MAVYLDHLTDTDSTSYELHDARIDGIESVLTDSTKNVPTSNAVKAAIQSAVSSVYSPQGSKTVAQLSGTVGEKIGYVYNMTDSGTIVQPTLSVTSPLPDQEVKAGDNVVWTADGWDNLGGSVDLSDYYNKSEIDTKISTINTSISTKADKTDLTSHINNSVVHVTQQERETWNNKAEKDVATNTANGLMSSDDKSKLDNIEAGAQKNTVTGVKGSAETSYRTGNIDITKANIGLGNVDNTADANKSVKSAATLTTTRKIDGVNFNGSADIVHYAACSTTATTAAKVAACTGFNLATGARIIVNFATQNTATSPTLNISSTGAKALQYQGAAIPANWLYGAVEFVYDGNAYQYVGRNDNDQTAIDSALSDTSVNPVQNKVITAALANKQATLTAGDRITIVNNAISADSQVFLAVYNTTKFADIVAAINAGKVVKCVTGSTENLDMVAYTSEFVAFNRIATDTSSVKICKVTSANVWTTTSRTIVDTTATQSANGLMSSTDKIKLDGIATGAEVNKIEIIQKNGTALAIENKTVNVTVPTKVSELTNDANYITKDDAAVSANKLSTARSIDGISFDGTADVIHFGTCSTVAATAAKVVTCANFKLVTGARITVKFTATNTAAGPTLNVNSTGAKSIMYNGGAIATSWISANSTLDFVYDGTNYNLIGRNDNTTYSNVSLGNGYAVQNNTAQATAITATLANYALVAHGYVSVRFLYAVPANATLNINGKGAKSIYHDNAAITADVIPAGSIGTFVYDGSYYRLVALNKGTRVSIDGTNHTIVLNGL